MEFRRSTRLSRSLPIGQLSGVIEGPDGFHIVKVEKRASGRPCRHSKKSRIKSSRILENAKFVAERNAFIAKLRKNTVITRYDLNPAQASRHAPRIDYQARVPARCPFRTILDGQKSPPQLLPLSTRILQTRPRGKCGGSELNPRIDFDGLHGPGLTT